MAKRYAADVFRRATREAHQTSGRKAPRSTSTCSSLQRAEQHELLWFGPASLDEEIAAAELDAPKPFVGIDAGV